MRSTAGLRHRCGATPPGTGHTLRALVASGTRFQLSLEIAKVRLGLSPQSSSILTYVVALVLSKKFVSGLIGGTLGVLMNTPLDVVKSRMQNQMTTAQPKYRYVLPSLLTILREEGVTALYKGLGPRMVRLGPGGGIMIVAFDVVSNMLS